jgi:hypothetical protein
LRDALESAVKSEGDPQMSLKAIFLSFGCLIAWLVLLPTFVVGGGVALFTYAVLAEFGAFLTGKPSQTLETSVAREMARRMCGGYRLPARSSRRLPSQELAAPPR